jgi:tetratricopeptide (TPR) repeat protein
MDSMNPTPSPAENQALLEQSLSYHQQGRLREALETYQRVLNSDPNHFEALHGIGILFGQLGRFEEAFMWQRHLQGAAPDPISIPA